MRAKTVILGVTGSIAACKAVDLASALVKAGCEVHVVMTADALRFVTALPFKTLSRHPVVTDLYDEEEGWKPSHIQLADQADLLLIAPATANTLAKLACGLADDALSCIALALNTEAQLLIAPAMNGKMWHHPATQANVATLKQRGAQFIGPEKGLLSCGYEGIGRLWPVDDIAKKGCGSITVNAEDKTRAAGTGTIQKLTRLLAAPTVEPSQRAVRIQAVERDIVLPLRALIIGILAYYFFFSGWFVTQYAARPKSHPHAATTSGITDQTNFAQVDEFSLRHAATIKTDFLIYAALNSLVGIILVWAPHLTLKKIEATVFAIGMLDALLMGTLTLLSRGFDSILFWVFPVLILHNALAIPVALPQLLLNFFVSAAFMAGGLLDKAYIATVDDPRLEIPAERLIVLAAWALCCYGIQMLFEKQKRAEAEATEFAVRQERLHTAGRLAAEIAHQIKNPLGIITNAAFSLQRAVHDGEMAVDEQIQIIREEVDHADQIITELMGYAQLAEGKVERLEVSDEVDNAILEVLPPAKYRIEVVKDYEPSLSALLMQKRHLSSVLVNLLQNAREAMNGVGRIEVSVHYGENESVIISIADNGPGIAPDKIDKIFEAHFTTRAKGTGLGLAIVKHNTEIYGGAVTVHSELGKGTRFTLEFPARILMRLSK